MNVNMKKSAVAAALVAGAISLRPAFAQDNNAAQAGKACDISTISIKQAARTDCTYDSKPQHGSNPARSDERNSLILEVGVGQVKSNIVQSDGGELNKIITFNGTSRVFSISYEQMISSNIGIKETYEYDGTQKTGGYIGYKDRRLALNGSIRTEGLGLQAVFSKRFGRVEPFVEAGIFAYQSDAQVTASYNNVSFGYEESGEPITAIIGAGIKIPSSSNTSLIFEIEYPTKTGSSRYELAPETLKAGISISF